jgi:hypothetical protein
MKLLCVTALLAALLPVLAAPVPPKQGKAKATIAQGKRRPASRSDALQQANVGHSNKPNIRRVTVRRMVHGKWVKVSRIVRVTGPVVQQHPDTERLVQIQRALAEKGYFKGEPNGAWDADSVAALKQFQTERNLPPDGKITALSLIGLGLGPKHEGNVASATQVKPETPGPEQP